MAAHTWYISSLSGLQRDNDVSARGSRRLIADTEDYSVYILLPTKEEVGSTCFACVCLSVSQSVSQSVSMSVSKITEKRVHGFG